MRSCRSPYGPIDVFNLTGEVASEEVLSHGDRPFAEGSELLLKAGLEEFTPKHIQLKNSRREASQPVFLIVGKQTCGAGKRRDVLHRQVLNFLQLDVIAAKLWPKTVPDLRIDFRDAQIFSVLEASYLSQISPNSYYASLFASR